MSDLDEKIKTDVSDMKKLVKETNQDIIDIAMKFRKLKESAAKPFRPGWKPRSTTLLFLPGETKGEYAKRNKWFVTWLLLALGVLRRKKSACRGGRVQCPVPTKEFHFSGLGQGHFLLRGQSWVWLR